MKSFIRFLLIVIIVAGFSSLSQSQTLSQPLPADSETIQLKNLLDRAGERIQKYHDAMFSITFTEVIRQQELKSDETPKNKPKEFVYESIVLSRPSRNQPSSIPVITRTLKTVEGKPTEQKNLKEPSKCGKINPQPNYADPLAFLLPQNQSNFIFSYLGETELEGRKAAIILLSQPPVSEPIKIVENGDCFHLSRSLRRQAKIWIASETYDVIQIQWQLAETFKGKISAGVVNFGFFPVFRPAREIGFDKQEQTIRFRPITFQNPDQTLLLPLSSESVWILKGARIEGYRTTTDYTRYRRFLTEVEVKDSNEDKIEASNNFVSLSNINFHYFNF